MLLELATSTNIGAALDAPAVNASMIGYIVSWWWEPGLPPRPRALASKPTPVFPLPITFRLVVGPSQVPQPSPPPDPSGAKATRGEFKTPRTSIMSVPGRTFTSPLDRDVTFVPVGTLS